MTFVGVGVGAAALIALHLVGARLRFLTYIPRSGWLSFAGGTSVAYVFVHLLPELAEGADAVERELSGTFASDHILWLVGLGGMVVFYGLEVASRGPRDEKRGGADSSVVVYRLTIASYAVYNAVIAYLLHERVEAGFATLALFVVAMALHFLVNDFALRQDHKERYERRGRWVLVSAIAVGAAFGAVSEVSVVAIELTIALIAGGVVLNVFKEELPSEAESRFSAFVAGAVIYAILLVAL